MGDVQYVDRLRNRQTHILGLLGAVEAGVSVSAEPWQGFCFGTSDAGKEPWSKTPHDGALLSLIGSSVGEPGTSSDGGPAR